MGWEELPHLDQPDGWMVLYRAERPLECRDAEQSVKDVIPGGSRGRWFTPSLHY